MQPNHIHVFVILLTAGVSSFAQSPVASVSPAAPTDVLTLQDALALALSRSPRLGVYPYEVRAAEARTLQAALWPNPQLELELEEFGGSGDRRGINGAEITVLVDQPIELGGKRGKRRELASLQAELVQWDYRAARLDVIRDATRAFVAVLAAQERLALAERLLHSAQRVQSAVAQRVEAGKDSPVKALQTSIILSRSRIRRLRAEKALTAARYALAAFWGGRDPAFEAVTGEFYEVPPAVPFGEAVEAIPTNPDIARRQTEEQRSRAALRLERAQSVPDITVGGGWRTFEETNDSAFVVGLSLPLPLFDRNEGRVREALAELEKARRQTAATEIRTRAAVASAVSVLTAACEQAATLRSEILPKARRAFEAAEEGYRQGKFDYLYVLETERTLFETQAEYIDVVEACHQARADVERLMGEARHFTRRDDLSVAAKERPVTGESK